MILEELHGPVCLVLSRQNVPILDRTVLAPRRGAAPRRLRARRRRGARRRAGRDGFGGLDSARRARPSCAGGCARCASSRCRAGSSSTRRAAEYREEVLPAAVTKISVEAAATFGWARWVDASIGIDSFGASGQGAKVLAHFGISPEAVAVRVREILVEPAQALSARSSRSQPRSRCLRPLSGSSSTSCVRPRRSARRSPPASSA